MKIITITITTIIILALLTTSCKKTDFPDNRVQIKISLQQTEYRFKDTALYDHNKTQTAKARSMRIQSSDTVIVFIQFNGGSNIPGAPWGIPGNFNCPSSGLNALKKDSIFNMVREDYYPFIIKVTKTLADYQQATGYKMICYVTKKNAKIRQSPILGPFAGVAYVSSILWGDGTGCFVFAEECGFNAKIIGEAVSHEVGHTFGNLHQQYYAPGCDFLGEYLPLSGDGQLSRGAIMGNPYQASLTNWIVSSCTGQDDAATIADIAGWRTEPYGDVLDNNTPHIPSSGISTVLVYSNSRHAFLKNGTAAKRVTLTSAGNIDIALEVYSSPNAQPIVYDNSNLPNINVVISGKKWFRIRLSTHQPFAMPDGQPFVYTAGGGYTLKLTNP